MCRLAEPGEFTKFAFQNNKMDLIRQKVLEILYMLKLNSKRTSHKIRFKGNASNIINLREKLVKSLSYIEAKIDFAEDDLPENVLKEVQVSIKQVHTDIKQISRGPKSWGKN